MKKVSAGSTGTVFAPPGSRFAQALSGYPDAFISQLEAQIPTRMKDKMDMDLFRRVLDLQIGNGDKSNLSVKPKPTKTLGKTVATGIAKGLLGVRKEHDSVTLLIGGQTLFKYVYRYLDQVPEAPHEGLYQKPVGSPFSFITYGKMLTSDNAMFTGDFCYDHQTFEIGLQEGTKIYPQTSAGTRTTIYTNGLVAQDYLIQGSDRTDIQCFTLQNFPGFLPLFLSDLESRVPVEVKTKMDLAIFKELLDSIKHQSPHSVYIGYGKAGRVSITILDPQQQPLLKYVYHNPDQQGRWVYNSRDYGKKYIDKGTQIRPDGSISKGTFNPDGTLISGVLTHAAQSVSDHTSQRVTTYKDGLIETDLVTKTFADGSKQTENYVAPEAFRNALGGNPGNLY